MSPVASDPLRRAALLPGSLFWGYEPRHTLRDSFSSRGGRRFTLSSTGDSVPRSWTFLAPTTYPCGSLHNQMWRVGVSPPSGFDFTLSDQESTTLTIFLTFGHDVVEPGNGENEHEDDVRFVNDGLLDPRRMRAHPRWLTWRLRVAACFFLFLAAFITPSSLSLSPLSPITHSPLISVEYLLRQVGNFLEFIEIVQCREDYTLIYSIYCIWQIFGEGLVWVEMKVWWIFIARAQIKPVVIKTNFWGLMDMQQKKPVVWKMNHVTKLSMISEIVLNSIV